MNFRSLFQYSLKNTICNLQPLLSPVGEEKAFTRDGCKGTSSRNQEEVKRPFELST